MKPLLVAAVTTTAIADERDPFDHLIDANKAQIVMLAEEGLVDEAMAKRIAGALADHADTQSAAGAERNPDYLVLEAALSETLGAEASNLHLGRSRNDLGAAMNRIALRDGLLRVMISLLHLGRSRNDLGATMNRMALRDGLLRVMTSLNLESLDFRVETLRERVDKDYSTMTEVADALYREAGIPFRNGYAFASALSSYGRERGKRPGEITWREARNVYASVLDGEVLPLDRAQFTAALDAGEIVNNRKGLGGPQPDETRRMLAEARADSTVNREWIAAKRSLLQMRRAELDHRFQELSGERPDTKPNIVLVLVDDMGWSDMGAFGGEIETPQLDELAENGLRFTQFHTTSKCFPSRGALLTGLYAEQVGMDESPFSRIERGVTIAEALGPAGYRSYMVGKHHALDNPVDRGFDRYVGLRDGASNHFNPGLVARPGEPLPARKKGRAKDGRWFCFDRDCVQGYTPESPNYYSTDFYTNRAIEFVDDALATEQPFFLYIAYQAPHDPLHAWPEDIAKYADRYRSGFKPIADARYQRMQQSGLIDESFPRSAPDFADWASMSDEQRADATRRMAVYAAMSDRVDQNLRRLIDRLKQADAFDNTLILFTSDNGASAELVFEIDSNEEIGAKHPVGTVGRWASLGSDWANVSNTPFRFYKNYPHGGGSVSPLIVHWPDAIVDPGRIVHANTHLIDILPTLLAVAGAEYPTAEPDGDPAPPLEGMDLSPYLRSSAPVDRGVPVFQRWQRGRSVRTERWKLLSYADHGQPAEAGEWELYDMSKDRTETTDVADRHPEVVARLAEAYEAWLARVKPNP